MTVNCTCSPGRTTPTVGLTDSQGLPAVAVNEIGVPEVVRRTLWAMGGNGGAANAKAVELNVKVDAGAVTFRLTGTVSGVVTPATVSVTVAGYRPTARLVGFARKLKVAGSLPLSGLTTSQSEFVPVTGPITESLPAAPLLIAAYAFVWIAVMFYVWTIWRRLNTVEAEMRALEQRRASAGSKR